MTSVTKVLMVESFSSLLNLNISSSLMLMIPRASGPRSRSVLPFSCIRLAMMEVMKEGSRWKASNPGGSRWDVVDLLLLLLFLVLGLVVVVVLFSSC